MYLKQQDTMIDVARTRLFPVLAVLALIICGITWLASPSPSLTDWRELPSQNGEVLSDQSAAQASDSAASERTSATSATVLPATVSTFLDGVPVPTLLVDVSVPPSGRLDWAGGTSTHVVPAKGDTFGVLGRGCAVVTLQRRSMPPRGDLRVDMQRCPVLDVRLTNVPPLIRERLDLQLQVEYDAFDSEEQNRASVRMFDRAPILMPEDRVLVPLSLCKAGRLVVHAKSRLSNISYATPKTPFDGVSQIVEIDASSLDVAGSLANLCLNLRLPFPYPGGDLVLSLVSSKGRTITHKKLVRNGDVEQKVYFNDLPREVLTPLLVVAESAQPRLYLAVIDMTKGDVNATRDVVSESSLSIAISGREGLAEDSVSVRLMDDSGNIVVADRPRGASLVFRHLPSMVAYVQAVSYDARLCSPIVRVPIGVAEAPVIALSLVPAGEVSVPAGAFGLSVNALDVEYSSNDVSCVFLKRSGVTRVWLPVGAPIVRWVGGQGGRAVVGGALNTWSAQ